MRITKNEKITVNRALGIIETVAALTDDKLAEKLYDALEMLEAVLDKED